MPSPPPRGSVGFPDFESWTPEARGKRLEALEAENQPNHAKKAAEKQEKKAAAAEARKQKQQRGQRGGAPLTQVQKRKINHVVVVRLDKLPPLPLDPAHVFSEVFSVISRKADAE